IVNDLEGRLVLPGLIDGHLHLVNGSLMKKKIDASVINNIETLRSKIKAYAEKNPQQSWIIGGNLDLNRILKESTQSNNFGDMIYSERPFYITNYDYHSAVCNTKALQESGLLNRLSDFSADEVVKDENGIPSGIIKEKALDFVFERLPQPSIDEKILAVDDFIKELHSYGITTVTDISLVPDLEVYLELYREGKLNVRINSYIPFEEFTTLNKHLEYTREIDKNLYLIK